MKFNEYQERCKATAVYPTGKGFVGETYINLGLNYCTLKLSGEAGELAEKLGKLYRDKEGRYDPTDIIAILKELGDVLWYVSQIATELHTDLSDVAQLNLDKLADRQSRGKLQGSGDNR